MPEQEVQQQPANLESPVQEAREGDAPKEGQIPSEGPSIEELKTSHKYWTQLSELCTRFPDAGKEINQVVTDYLTGKKTKAETTEVLNQLNPEPSIKKEPSSEKKEPSIPAQYETRIREMEKEILNSKIDNTIKKLSADKRYGSRILEKQVELEQAVYKAGLVPSINAGTLSLEKAFEMTWRDMDWDNQLTKGQDQVISEIEEKRSVQGPSLQKSNVTQMVAPKPKTFKEALLQAEKDLGYTIEEAKEALYRR